MVEYHRPRLFRRDGKFDEDETEMEWSRNLVTGRCELFFDSLCIWIEAGGFSL